LHANKLQDTITKMHDDNKYSKMVLYVEACESGSMFNKILGSNLSVYAVTASTPFESSYACYQDNYAHQYIGDCFSNHVHALSPLFPLSLALVLTLCASGWKTRMLRIGRAKRFNPNFMLCMMPPTLPQYAPMVMHR
jgi:hypothetical protein